MAFPNLTLRPGGSWHAEATGVPVNGDNTFDTGLSPNNVDQTDWIDWTVAALGASIQGASVVNYNIVGNQVLVTMSFIQTGGDACEVKGVMNHSVVR